MREGVCRGVCNDGSNILGHSGNSLSAPGVSGKLAVLASLDGGAAGTQDPPGDRGPADMGSPSGCLAGLVEPPRMVPLSPAGVPRSHGPSGGPGA
jgi:hypothetical protein